MFRLVSSVADRLASLTLRRSDVLSLMGAALFFRFLLDRHVVQDKDRRRIIPSASKITDAFADAQNASATSAWLDNTFNGDLLPLSDVGSKSFFEEIGRRTGGRVFLHMCAIIRGDEPSGDENYQIPLGLHFGYFDFAHIPVGLLSQVYERFAWKWEHQNAKDTSVHYTPRSIAATLVDEAFSKLPNAAQARVLDPACGASVFLVLAFRRLYQERWKATRKRPDTKAIRDILENQLRGFDISDSAIKLAALSLYLTAIELDPKPAPPEKLKFQHLRDSVIFNFRRVDSDPDEGPVAGSLGAHVGHRFDGCFDLVLSNPPWTTLTKKDAALAQELNLTSKRIIGHRGGQEFADNYENPDFGPDLPFVWKATEWCKPGGRIAMALPARILLKQEPSPRHARETLFKLIEITAIINGMNLSDTPVWPQMGQPFMLLFARNQIPRDGHSFRLITPVFDDRLNQKGEMRIDFKSVQAVSVETIVEQPWILKTLGVGTPLDAEVINKMKSAKGRPLQLYWEQDLGLVSRNGYQPKENQIQRDASFMFGLPDLNSTHLFRFVVDAENLQPFKRPTLCRPRDRDTYRGPLTLMLLSPKSRREDGWALLSLNDIAYNQSFHGYSAAGHADAKSLARYLHLFVHSYVWMHYALLTSPKFGAERREIYKADLDECPVLPFGDLSAAQRERVLELSSRLEENEDSVFKDIDLFFGNLFGLTSEDLEVVKDTVDVAMPYSNSRVRACVAPQSQEYERFRKRIESILRPFFVVTGDEVKVELYKPLDTFLQSNSPFGVLVVSIQGAKPIAPEDCFRELILQLANETGTTQIIQRVQGGLVLALLNQYRYWTPSRARLLAAEIVREHLDVFEVET